ncbi:hypothetical protein BKA64DRAFT_645967 [Cadophora sp. MPI-SDFR-AT-0126]|nr:hypothetical protein BKA64DRAFT_645967 [Leotiomycetes sp. MPI-SDFR-AT-0126]
MHFLPSLLASFPLLPEASTSEKPNRSVIPSTPITTRNGTSLWRSPNQINVRQVRTSSVSASFAVDRSTCIHGKRSVVQRWKLWGILTLSTEHRDERNVSIRTAGVTSMCPGLNPCAVPRPVVGGIARAYKLKDFVDIEENHVYSQSFSIQVDLPFPPSRILNRRV